MEPKEKYCSGCEKTLPRSDFWNNKSKKDGLMSHCKTCRKDAEKKQGGHKYNKTGMTDDDGFLKITVKCWNHREGCPNTRDFFIAKGDKHPRLVCDDCNEAGYMRAGNKTQWSSLGRVLTPTPTVDPRTAGVIILTPKSRGFAAVAKTITHISEIKFSSQKFIDKGWK